ncbi:MAG: phosphate--acyl-ACP acyltransferase, partial [Thermodesulfobacteriota bacterium]
MKIAVDAMGGDHGPAAIVAGSVEASSSLGIPIILVGDRVKIESELKKYPSDSGNISIRHAS